MAIDDIKHCLSVMIDCEVCEECNLYGTTGTDHCEHDCVCRALDIIDKYQKIKQIYENWNEVNDFSYNQAMQKIGEVLEDGNDKRGSEEDGNGSFGVYGTRDERYTGNV